MDPEVRQKVVELLELTRENNKMLKGMRSSQRWASFFRFIYWIIWIGAAVAAYYFFQPYLNEIKGLNLNMPSITQLQSYFAQNPQAK